MAEFLGSLPTAWLFILLSIFLVIFIGLIIIALREGREISVWPPKIGPKIGIQQEKTKILDAFENFGIIRALSSLEDIPRLFELEKAINFKRIRVLARSWHSTIRKIENILPSLRNTDIYILILDPDCEYVEERVKENPYDTVEKVRNEIHYSIGKLKEVKLKYSMNRLHIRKYEMLPIFRLIIIDDLIYFSYYPKAAPGTTVPVFEIRRQEPSFYQALERYFEFVWRTSQDVL